MSLVVRLGDQVEAVGVVVKSISGPYLIQNFGGPFDPHLVYPEDVSGVPLISLPGSVAPGSVVKIHGVWEEDGVHVHAVDVSRHVQESDHGLLGVDLPRTARPTMSDVLALNRLADGRLALVIDQKAPDVGAWQRASIITSGWSKESLDRTERLLGELKELTAVGQSQNSEGDVVLIVGLTHVSAKAASILEKAPPHLVDLHLIVAPLSSESAASTASDL